MRQLHDDHPLVRYLAVEALGATGAADAQIMVALEAQRNDTDELVRFAAAEALEALRAGHPTLPVTSRDKEGG
jgi:HEAT repeat protein